MLVPSQTGTHVDHIGIVTWTSSEFEILSIRARTGPRSSSKIFFLRTRTPNSQVPLGSTISHGLSTTNTVISELDADTSSHFEFEQTKSQPK